MKLILNISGPDGMIFSKTLDSGAAPYVDLAASLETRYTNGSYTYELRVVPANADDVDHPNKIGGKNLKKWPAAIDIFIIPRYDIKLVWYDMTRLGKFLTVNWSKEVPGCRGSVERHHVSFFRESLYSQISKFE